MYSLESESWRAVIDFEGFFEVSNFGNVRALKRTFYRQHNRTSALVKYTYRAAPVKQWINATTGYPMVDLRANGRRKKDSVHRLVLRAFMGEPKPGMIACHFNGNPLDCNLSNLRWDTYSANVADCRRHGRLQEGERAAAAKLRTEDVRIIKSELETPRPGLLRILGRRYNVTPEAIAAIRDGKNWKSVK